MWVVEDEFDYRVLVWSRVISEWLGFSETKPWLIYNRVYLFNERILFLYWNYDLEQVTILACMVLLKIMILTFVVY